MSRTSGGRVAHIITPQERLRMSLQEPSEATMPPPSPQGWSQQIIIGIVVVLAAGALTFVGAALSNLWRGEPLTAATLQRIEQRLDKVESRVETATTAQTRSEGQIMANKQEIEALKRTLDDIKTYQYRTSEEMKAMSAELARVGGWITRTNKDQP